MVAWIDSPGNWGYTATKYGLRGFMRTARRNPHEQVDRGVEFGEQIDRAACMMRIATDRSINGRSLMITPRSIAKAGFIDSDREDYKDTAEDAYLRKTQASQLVIIED
ncbi:hypothetical protein BDZ85DRAFT_272236 [Elsinoe ampelina]|uniref:Uncharacterized protein n=1 Tax=Elsinoe ampelina TaxID=302913 RepID=A0A6A6GIV2_9PEZI|nr:hypothetical protein BDZ85DRAFT_272236 [Elsinoe ampelina]